MLCCCRIQLRHNCNYTTLEIEYGVFLITDHHLRMSRIEWTGMSWLFVLQSKAFPFDRVIDYGC